MCEDRPESKEVSRALATELLGVICDLARDPTTALLVDNCFLKEWESREYDYCKPDDRLGKAAELMEMINFIESNLAAYWI